MKTYVIEYTDKIRFSIFINANNEKEALEKFHNDEYNSEEDVLSECLGAIEEYEVYEDNYK